MPTITRSAAITKIKENGGKIFSVTFTKKDNTEKTLTCRTGVKSYTSGKGAKYDAAALGYTTVWDLPGKSYKNVNNQTISGLKIRGEQFKVK